MNYSETLAYLFHKLPMFSRIGEAAFKKGLTNTLLLCKALNNPQNKFAAIHVAGTNGKGSTSHMLAAILQTAGFKTGLYTSPHLKDFRERIKVNGQSCNEKFVVEFVEKMKGKIEEIEPSFFEITVVMAFEYFSQQQVDVAIIETGLGGRLDSTNVITPELSIITNIGYDHMNMLGNSLEQIAFEKAGIIKPNIPVVVGEVLPETQIVFETTSKQQNSSLIFAEHTRYVVDWEILHHHLHITVVNKQAEEHTKYALDLTGIYQLKNIITVLEAVHQLRQKGWNIEKLHVQQALQQIKKLTGLHGRWEKIHTKPDVVLDVAHNLNGMQQLVSQLEHCKYQQLHIVIGMVKDKDISGILSILPSTANYYFTQASIPRALPITALQKLAMVSNLRGKCFDNVNMALKAALEQAKTDDLILVCGSVFIISEVDMLAV